MLHIVPDYYKDFKCIADKCRHNCCIGWEIDIDLDTAELYRQIGGDFGLRLKNAVSNDGEPHFILKEKGPAGYGFEPYFVRGRHLSFL